MDLYVVEIYLPQKRQMYWEADNVLMTIVNVSVYYIAFEWYAQMASVISDNILVGLLAMIVYWYCAV